MISKELLNYVADGDEHTRLSSVEHSTNLREIVTVGHMIEHFRNEKAADAGTSTALGIQTY